MPDLIAIAQGLNAVKAIADITKVMSGLRDSAKFLDKTVELTQKTLDVQISLTAALSEQSTLVQTINDLEKENTQLKAWDADKDHYRMEKLPPGIIIYTLKQESSRPGEIIHSICPTCYGNGKNFPLHEGEANHGQYDLTCHSCGNFSSWRKTSLA